MAIMPGREVDRGCGSQGPGSRGAEQEGAREEGPCNASVPRTHAGHLGGGGTLGKKQSQPQDPGLGCGNQKALRFPTC